MQRRRRSLSIESVVHETGQRRTGEGHFPSRAVVTMSLKGLGVNFLISIINYVDLKILLSPFQLSRMSMKQVRGGTAKSHTPRSYVTIS